MTLTLCDAAGAVIRTNRRSFPPNYLAQLSSSGLVGGDLGPNQSIVISIDSGSAVVYGSTISNNGQGSTFQIAARVVVP